MHPFTLSTSIFSHIAPFANHSCWLMGEFHTRRERTCTERKCTAGLPLAPHNTTTTNSNNIGQTNNSTTCFARFLPQLHRSLVCIGVTFAFRSGRTARLCVCTFGALCFYLPFATSTALLGARGGNIINILKFITTAAVLIAAEWLEKIQQAEKRNKKKMAPSKGCLRGVLQTPHVFVSNACKRHQ